MSPPNGRGRDDDNDNRNFGEENMSRLDSFIRRVSAQRDCLNHAAGLARNKSGPILELGLGNGRTYDHLRHLFPDRDIYVFDRHVMAHPDCIPDDDHMIIGDFLDTVPRALERTGQKAVLAHCDIGSGDKELTAKLAANLERHLPGLLTADAIIVSDQAFNVEGWIPLALPDGIAPGRYYLYQVRA